MDRHADESRLELDLDNRKLIIGFALLMVICAGFFVFGFIEGKRQALRTEPRVAESPVPAPESRVPSQTESKPALSDSAAKPAPPKPINEQLDWYKKVNSHGKRDAKDLASLEAKKPSTPPTRIESSRPADLAQKATYSVQIGAFRNRREAENRAAVLKAKGYDSFVEPSKPGAELYLLKVGRFDSRAAAVASQLKLKKDGFASFIKSN